MNRQAKLEDAAPEDMLKMVLEREAATAARYDARIAELERERDEAREQARMSSFMGEGYAFVERRAMVAEAEVARLSGLLKEAKEVLREIDKQSDVSDTEWVNKLRPPHLVRMLALANKLARVTLARLAQEPDR